MWAVHGIMSLFLRSAGHAALTLLLCGSVAPHTLAGQRAASDTLTTHSVRRATASGLYADTARAFRFHGYATLTFSENGEALGSEVGRTPQTLIPGTSPRSGVNPSGFKQDAAIFIGGEPVSGIRTVVEVHFEGNALDPILTEAKLTWDLVGRDGGDAALRLTAGRFWWPFGQHDREWFSTLNSFTALSPAAGEVVPAHYNEVGAMLEGEVLAGPDFGFNYLVAVGNGTPSFELADNVGGTAFDENENRTVTSRVGFAFRNSGEIDLGFSVAHGTLREGLSTTYADTDARRYGAKFTAYGPDLSVSSRHFGLRAYYYVSRESLIGAPLPHLDRDGLTVEPRGIFYPDIGRLTDLTVHGRFSFSDELNLDGRTFRRLQYALGASTRVAERLSIKVSYILQREKQDATEVPNSIFVLALTAEF